MISEKTHGVYVIAVTPFTDSGEIDYPSFDRVTEFYIERGVHGISVLGMMGEAQKLTFEESVRVAAHVVRRAAGRVPVLVGVTNPALAAMRTLCRSAMDAGAAGVFLAPAQGLRTEDQIVSYYAEAFEAIGPDIPVAYQDYPQSSGVFVSVTALQRMIRAFPQLVMLKHEDCPGLGKISQLRAASAESGLRRLSILVGNGGLYFPQELRRGADGAMTGFAFPEMLVETYRRFVAGDPDTAEDLFDKYLPVLRHEQQPGFGLAIRKETLRRRGAIATAAVRRPGPVLTTEDHAELDRLLARLEKALQAWGDSGRGQDNKSS
jgi:4-hydroxy-tetrahydrodipicolinate synthase